MSRMKYFDMMRRTAKRVCKILEEKGFKTYISNTRPLPIRKILRESWYVEKMSQFGIIDVIHIGIYNGNYHLGPILSSRQPYMVFHYGCCVCAR